MCQQDQKIYSDAKDLYKGAEIFIILLIEHPIYYGANQISCQELSMQKFELLLLELFEREKRANRQNGQTS